MSLPPSILLPPRTPLQHALHDGEDYELLFTAPRCDHPQAIRIGTIEPGAGAWIVADGQKTPLAPLAWEHRL
jgi:thiamine monophosphate kinase